MQDENSDDDEEKKDPDDLDDHANSNRLSNENIQTHFVLDKRGN